MLDFDAIMASASLPEETVPICLDGKLVRQYEEVKDRVDARAAEVETADGDVRLSTRTRPKVDQEQGELDRLTAEVQAKNVPFLVRAMSRDTFAEFMANPDFTARKDPKTGELNPRDVRLGVNSDVFVPALVKACLADPDVSVDGRWELLRAKLNNSQMGRLFTAAWSVNNEDRDVPFSPGGSPSPLNSATA